MKKFESLLTSVGKKYLLTEEQLGINQGDGSAIDSEAVQNAGAAPQGEGQPQPEQAAPEQQEKLTPEGKRYLIELAMKALSIDPNSLAESDRSLFNEEVNAQNADEILNRIQAIVDEHT